MPLVPPILIAFLCMLASFSGSHGDKLAVAPLASYLSKFESSEIKRENFNLAAGAKS